MIESNSALRCAVCCLFCCFFFKQKTAYEMRISDWSSDVCSSDLSGSALLAKGGHATGEMVEDTLITPDGGVIFANPRIDTRHTHGTGCTLSSALPTGLGQGLPLDRPVARGLAIVRAAIPPAPESGRGSGPMGHAPGRGPFAHGE